jgi:glucosamine-6-phosphate deaminase
MRLVIKPDYLSISKWLSDYVVEKILQSNKIKDKFFVLGLPTGSSSLGMYNCLIKHYQNKVISFKNVVTFNMDEYIGLPKEHPESYHSFMWKNFFNHVDILPENVNILDGNAVDLDIECEIFEKKIKKVCGIDIFIGGIGINGHIAFNEPGSSFSSRTRIKTLTQDTIISNSRFFENNIQKVPKQVLTVGIGTILDSEEVLIIISGHNKARILSQVIEGSVSQMYPVTALQLHKKSVIVCDEAATAELKVGTYRYFKELE